MCVVRPMCNTLYITSLHERRNNNRSVVVCTYGKVTPSIPVVSALHAGTCISFLFVSGTMYYVIFLTKKK